MSEIKTWAFWRAVLAECLGMIIFVFVGLSAAIGDKNNSYPDQEIKVAFAFGLAVATLAQCLGHISGAHLNPAITLGLLASCHMSILRAFFYIIAQILGAVAGSAIVYGIRPENIDSLGVNKLNGISPCQGFGVEFLLTLQLVLCVLAVNDKRRDVGGCAPLAIGLSVGLGHLAGISYTGCGINPARSLGPAVIQKSFDDHWVYWAGPVSGGVVAALLYYSLLVPRDEPLSEQARVLFCCGSTIEDQLHEPLLEDAKEWSRRTVHLIYIKLGRFVAEGHGKCSDEFGATWTKNTFSVKLHTRSYNGNSIKLRLFYYQLLQLNVTAGQGCTIDFLASLQWVLWVIAVTDKRQSDVKGFVPLAIGLSVGVGQFAPGVWLTRWQFRKWAQQIATATTATAACCDEFIISMCQDFECIFLETSCNFPRNKWVTAWCQG